MAEWIAIPERTFTKWAVVQRQRSEAGERTTRVIADDLTREEAHLIASSREVLGCLEKLLNIVLEGEQPSDEQRRWALRVFLTSQGLVSAA